MQDFSPPSLRRDCAGPAFFGVLRAGIAPGNPLDLCRAAPAEENAFLWPAGEITLRIFCRQGANNAA